MSADRPRDRGTPVTAPDDTVRIWLGPAFSGDVMPMSFRHPKEILCCERPEDVASGLARLTAATAQDLWAVGFFSYELGYCLEPRLRPLLPEPRHQPLLWFALFEQPDTADQAPPPKPACSGWMASGLRASWTREAYATRFARVHDYLRQGDTYQINLTFKLRMMIQGDRTALFRDLHQRQPVGFAAHLSTSAFDLMSLSPELFFSLEGRDLTARPMKGTAHRSADAAADEAAAAWLHTDAKSRAENLMIVDLLRNDLGRVSEIGSVRVTDLFTVERYPTVHQMTSGITARSRPDTDLPALLQALFPCGSVTGAPKIRAMEIVRELEEEPRGVYTGAIGLIRPGGDAFFNVAIRTLFIDRDGTGEMGIGSGLVFDSEADAEFDECLLKSRFLTKSLPDFQLLETMLWAPTTGWFLLDRHLSRLAGSANALDVPLDPVGIRNALDEAVANAAHSASPKPHRVRLLVARDGTWTVTATPRDPVPTDTVLRAVLSDHPVHSGDPFLYHKTTRRTLYERELARLSARTGCDEVLFVNEYGALCEGSRTNIFLERDGRLLTPPITCGVLPGTLRAHLLATRPASSIVETVLTPADLQPDRGRLLLGNSVNGLVPAIMLE